MDTRTRTSSGTIWSWSGVFRSLLSQQDNEAKDHAVLVGSPVSHTRDQQSCYPARPVTYSDRLPKTCILYRSDIAVFAGVTLRVEPRGGKLLRTGQSSPSLLLQPVAIDPLACSLRRCIPAKANTY